MKETADRKVKTDLVLEAIAKAENFEVSEEELKEKAQEVAKMYSAEDSEKMADLILKAQESVLKHDVLVEKTIKLLVENAKVK
jgi:trigger factor